MIGIYKITNKVNGKVYIGQSDNIERRWKNHKKDAFWPNSHVYNYPLYRAMRKYGLDNFLFEILEKCKKEELNQKEVSYIAQYDSFRNGYNQDEGGTAASHPLKLTPQKVQEIIQILKTSNKTNTQIAKDFGVSEGMIRNINAGVLWVQPNETYPIRTTRTNNKLTIAQNKKPRTYASRKPNFCACCNAPISSYATHCRKCSNKLEGLNNRKVVQRPPSLELAKMVCESSFEEIGRQYGISGRAVQKWCAAYGIPHTKEALKKWYYQQIGVEYLSPSEHVKKLVVRKKVQQIDLQTGQVLHLFDSPTEASRYLHKPKGHISDVCLGKRKSAYGYGWKYIEE